MDAEPPARVNVSPDRLAELEEEKRFLLRSISDLERERAAGDVEDGDYTALRDGYTARAAAVLRAIDQGRSGLAPKRPRDWKRLIGATLAVLLIGVVAGILVARASGQRDPGDTITGGTSPDQVAALLSEGKSLLAVNDYGEASKRYLAVLDIDANNVEALTYAGWVLAVSTQGMADAEAKATVFSQSAQFLEKAIAIDPAYAVPHCFEAIIAGFLQNDLPTATTARAACLASNPSSEMRGLIAENVDPLLNPTSGVTADSSTPTVTTPTVTTG